ncbi:hypothetical protein SY83_21255 [Paenibacillus swuensis]|uniref:Sugar ABC transporter substrate-binding protein n=1 Tax=Paenibacillus swuensis TaxID=1178515 RepID=A0A172TMX9_9BACL|nr:sugar ABC transporter substrate-binding protein [Paenibacillus swuensis]ANE48388.1 hypothetical protein SY83_21255 [Paenibacillus swuensis]
MKKAWITSLALTLMLTSVVGCSSGNNTNVAKTNANPSANGNTAKEVKLKFSIWGNETHAEMYQGMAETFKETHPNVSVEIMSIPLTDYQQKLSIMSASKTAPDLGWVAERMIPQFISANQIIDISEVKSDAEYNFNDFNPVSYELFDQEGKLYGIPFSTPPAMIFYNKSLFQAKGLKTPTELYKEGKWTYEEFSKAAKELTDPSKGVYGAKLFRESKNWSDAIVPLVWSHGADLFNEEGNRFAMNTPEGLQALQLFDDLMFKDESHVKPGDQTTFESGKLAMFQDRYSNVTKARAIQDFEWDIAPMPSGPKGTVTSLGLAGYSVFEGTKHAEEALAFLKFISNQENMSTTAKYFVPSRTAVLNSDAFMKSDPKPSAESIKLAVIDQMTNAKFSPAHKNWQKIDSEMQIMFDLLYTRTESVDQVLKRMEEHIDPLTK